MLNTHEPLYPFPDHIFTQNRKSALQYSNAIFKQGIIPRCLVIWVDASVAGARTPSACRLITSAVRYLDLITKRWMEFVTFNTLSYGSQYAFEAEFVAVHEAFRLASEFTGDFDRVVIFLDNQAVLHGLKKKSTFPGISRSEFVNGLLRYANSLYDLGITVELQWVPAHSAVEGNERVDKLATGYRRTAQLLIDQEAPGLVVNNVTITPGSLPSLRQALFDGVEGIQKTMADQQIDMHINRRSSRSAHAQNNTFEKTNQSMVYEFKAGGNTFTFRSNVPLHFKSTGCSFSFTF